MSKSIELGKIRTAIANYIESEGCSCCQDENHNEHQALIGRLLEVPKYSDGSGYNFTEFETEE